MTTELIELSKQAAEVLGVPANIDKIKYGKPLNEQKLWLAEDSGRCADIAVDRLLDTDFFDPKRVWVSWFDDNDKFHRVYEYLSDHNNDRKQAWRVAVLKAVIEQGKQS